MKKIIIALAVLCCVQFAYAQVKPAADIRKSVESAEAAAENPKKVDNPATWLKIGNAYVTAYSNPMGAGWIGANQQELSYILGSDKPKSSESVTLDGAYYTKDVFETRNYYYDENGVLQIIEVTQPVYEDPLDRALEAYKTAYEKDIKHSKNKDLTAAFANVAGKLHDEALCQYSLGNIAAASVLFEKAARASNEPPYSNLDSLSLYHAGFTAWAGGDYERAKDIFEEVAEIGFYNDGDTYAKLGDVYNNLQDTLKAKAVLEEGFQKFPENQVILIYLINYYVTSGENPDQLFALLDKAKEHDPNNASLYSVEGDIHKKLGELDAAVAAYEKAVEIDPNYEFGYIGIGQLYYDQALEYQDEAANELDDDKYNALMEKVEESLIKSAEPFEKAFETTKSDDIKIGVAQYLKNVYYRVRTKSDEYQAAYDKYNDITTNGL